MPEMPNGDWDKVFMAMMFGALGLLGLLFVAVIMGTCWQACKFRNSKRQSCPENPSPLVVRSCVAVIRSFWTEYLDYFRATVAEGKANKSVASLQADIDKLLHELKDLLIIESKPSLAVKDDEGEEERGWFDGIYEAKSVKLLKGKIIGRGASGVVQEGVMKEAGREPVRVAFKHCAADSADIVGIASESKIANLQKEQKKLKIALEILEEGAKLKKLRKHANIVSLVGVMMQQNKPSLVMEYMDGGSLHDYLNTEADEVLNILNVFEALEVFKAIAAAVAYMHGKGIVHRDIACRNVLITTGRTAWSNRQIKLCDLGLGRTVLPNYTHQNISRTALPLWQLAPECFGIGLPPKESRQYHTKSDVWQLGLFLVELFNKGRSPTLVSHPNDAHMKALFDRDWTSARGRIVPEDVWQKIPEQLRGLVNQLLKRNCGHRPTAAEIHGDRLEAVWNFTYYLLLYGGLIFAAQEKDDVAKPSVASCSIDDVANPSVFPYSSFQCA